MYEKNQIINITKTQLDKALRYFPSVNYDIDVDAESRGEGTFLNDKIPCVAKDRTLVVNMDWFNKTSEKDIIYIIWHEARHFYQRQQVEAFQKGLICIEELDTLITWEEEFNSYVPNTAITEQKHFSQKIEMDAYAFASAMAAIHWSKADGSVDIALPTVTAEKIVEMASEMCKEYYKVPVLKEKVDRNGECPCGSGRKYKKCCMRTSFFE